MAKFVEALRGIRQLSDARGLPAPIFAVLNQGTATDRPTDYNRPDEELSLYLRWYRQAEVAAREAGFVTYNHAGEIAAELSDVSLAVNVLDGHPSAALNDLYGRKLFETLVSGDHAGGLTSRRSSSRSAAPTGGR